MSCYLTQESEAVLRRWVSKTEASCLDFISLVLILLTFKLLGKICGNLELDKIEMQKNDKCAYMLVNKPRSNKNVRGSYFDLNFEDCCKLT